MKKIILVILLLSSAAYARTYSTAITATENPISQGGNWSNGAAQGTNWKDVQTTPGFVFGTQSGSAGGFDDSTAIVTGSWGATQTAEAVVSVSSQPGGQEIELRLRSAISSGSNTGYEFNFSVGSSHYNQIIRWNGALGNFTQIGGASITTFATGDHVKATANGCTLTEYKAPAATPTVFTVIASATDCTWTTGAPGLGFWRDGGGVNTNFGFSSFIFSDTAGPVHYFVTQAGAGSQTGLSLGNAWSVANFNASSLPTSGDTVSFSGTITSTVIPAKSGSSGNLLTLDFTGATLNTANPRISITGKNFLDIIGGTFGTATTGTLISFNSTIHNGNIVEGWTFVGGTGGTNNCGCTTAIDQKFPQNFTIRNNSFDNVLTLGYSDTTNTHDILITGNFIRTGPIAQTTANLQSDVISYGDAANVTIEKNKLVNQAAGQAANNHNDVIQTFHSGSSPSGNPTNWIIRYNWLELAQTDGSGGNMSWNEIENIAGDPGMTVCNNVYVGNNTSWAGGNGVSWHNATAGAKYYVYNNTFAQKQSPLNIIRWGQGDGSAATLNSVNNAFFSTLNQPVSLGSPFSYSTVVANFMWNVSNATGTNLGTGGSAALLTSSVTDFANNDFSPSVGSILRSAGTSSGIPAGCSQGIAPGSTFPNPTLVTRTAGTWDVGAFQSASGSFPIAQILPANSGFAPVVVGQTSATAIGLTVNNIGSADLVVNSLAVSGDFVIFSNACPATPFTLTAGTNCAVNIKFSPTQLGTRNGALTITDNATGSPHSGTFNGTGIPPTAPAVGLFAKFSRLEPLETK